MRLHFSRLQRRSRGVFCWLTLNRREVTETNRRTGCVIFMFDGMQLNCAPTFALWSLGFDPRTLTRLCVLSAFPVYTLEENLLSEKKNVVTNKKQRDRKKGLRCPKIQDFYWQNQQCLSSEVKVVCSVSNIWHVNQSIITNSRLIIFSSIVLKQPDTVAFTKSYLNVYFWVAVCA